MALEILVWLTWVVFLLASVLLGMALAGRTIRLGETSIALSDHLPVVFSLFVTSGVGALMGAYALHVLPTTAAS